jgi:hypothetical protein
MSSRKMTSGFTYFDEATGKWTSLNHQSLPLMLVISWWPENDEELRQFLEKAKSLPAQLVQINKDDPRIIEYLKINDPVVCVAFISKAGLEEPSCKKVITECEKLVIVRHEFRLYVQLFNDLSVDELRKAAAENLTGESVEDILVRSIHLPGKQDNNIANTLKRISEHFSDLSRLQHRIARERLESIIVKILSFFTISLIIVLTITSSLLPVYGISLKATKWFPWVYFCIGYLSYLGLINFLTFLKPITKGSFFRWTFLILTCYLAFAIHDLIPYLKFYWLYFVAGGLVSFLTDTFNRFLIERKRLDINFDTEPVCEKNNHNYPGKVPYGFIWTGPWFPGKTRIFISYSTKSVWGKNLAETLFEKFRKNGIECFYAPASIELGSSWRHRLKSEMYNTNLFIQLLDDITTNSGGGTENEIHWPAKELEVASRHQLLSSLPTIVLVYNSMINSKEDSNYSYPRTQPGNITTVRDPGKLPPLETCEKMHPYIKKVLYEVPCPEISSLHILIYREGIEDELVKEFSKNYRWNAVSVLPLKLAAILSLVLMIPATLLSSVGILCSMLLWGLPIAMIIMYLQNLSLLNWLASHNLDLIAFIILNYTLGFVSRLLFASFFEVWSKYSKNSGKWRIVETIFLVIFCTLLFPGVDLIGLILGLISIAFGILVGSYYLNMSISAKGWVKS